MTQKTPPLHHLKAWREHRGLKQQQLADMIHKTKGEISRWENGGRNLSDEDLIKVCKALGIEPFALYLSPDDPIFAQQVQRFADIARTMTRERVQSLLDALTPEGAISQSK